MSFEVEQKFPISDPASVEAQLVRMGGRREEACRQVDCYYAHPSRDFAGTDEALRIRTVGETNTLTYKGPKLDATTKTRREIELPIERGQAAAEKAQGLLEALGFTPVAEVRKQRRTLQVPWEGREVEVALDQVEGLGNFLELELCVPRPDQIPRAKDCLVSLATALGLTAGERRSYLELLLARPAGGKQTP